MSFTIKCAFDREQLKGLEKLDPPVGDPVDFAHKFLLGAVKNATTQDANKGEVPDITFSFNDKSTYEAAWRALESFSPLELKGMQNGVIERTRAAIQEKK